MARPPSLDRGHEAIAIFQAKQDDSDVTEAKGDFGSFDANAPADVGDMFSVKSRDVFNVREENSDDQVCCRVAQRESYRLLQISSQLVLCRNQIGIDVRL